jgi:hypothetical protein
MEPPRGAHEAEALRNTPGLETRESRGGRTDHGVTPRTGGYRGIPVLVRRSAVIYAAPGGSAAAGDAPRSAVADTAPGGSAILGSALIEIGGEEIRYITTIDSFIDS